MKLFNFIFEVSISDLNQLSLAKTKKEKLLFLKSNLKYLGKGTSRIVFEFDNETVIKFALNEAGKVQNENEVSTSRNYNHITTKVYNIGPDFEWIQTEKARKAKTADFKKITGMQIGSFLLLLSQVVDEITNYKKPHFAFPEDRIRYFNFKELQIVKDLEQLILDNDLIGGDLTKINSWGVVNRDGKEHLVLIDFGANSQTYETYYQK